MSLLEALASRVRNLLSTGELRNRIGTGEYG